ncbi:hypothetical protein EW146_g4947 [Bondarzewia mesenterica]|uniref:Major facilitator superfamily (MFS) profile domain-containing protein n=1 Tax=Bondarzewia mesenterica TaxID=1095465 RepID=A0A4S4LSX7_9AGAM|nr:hypothetical protein EW146_g4947 [Bondarzewia mesenterica]
MTGFDDRMPYHFLEPSYSNAYGVFQGFYIREYLSDRSSSDISWIGSLQVMLMLSLGLVTGHAYDTGYLCGSRCLDLYTMLMPRPSPQSPSHDRRYSPVFLSQGLGLGLAFGMTYIPSVGIISHYFQRRRALAMGIVASGSSLGSIVHPIMLNQLFHGSARFSKGVRYSAIFNLGLMILANVFMRPRLPPKKAGNVFAGATAFAHDAAYVLIVIGTVLVIMGLFFPIFYLQLDAISQGLDATFSFYSLTILNTASFVGRLFSSVLAQYFGVFNTILPFTAACGVLAFTMFSVKTVASIVVFAILYGLSSSAYVGLLAPMIASLSSDFSEIGSREWEYVLLSPGLEVSSVSPVFVTLVKHSPCLHVSTRHSDRRGAVSIFIQVVATNYFHWREAQHLTAIIEVDGLTN